MPRGGKRKGAGRKKGSLSILNRKTAELAAAKGITPLEFMLQTMWALWEEANGRTVTLNTAKAKEAMVVADRAAPYCHPRIAALDQQSAPPPDDQVVDKTDVARRLLFMLNEEDHKRKNLPSPKKKVREPA